MLENNAGHGKTAHYITYYLIRFPLLVKYTHTGDFVFFSPPHGVLFSAICSIERADRERRRYLQIWRHATQGVRSILSAPRAHKPFCGGAFSFRVLDFSGVINPPPQRQKRELDPFLGTPSHLKTCGFGVFGESQRSIYLSTMSRRSWNSSFETAARAWSCVMPSSRCL